MFTLIIVGVIKRIHHSPLLSS